MLDIGGQQDDWRAALAYARALDGVDTSRVVAWGTSFGAGHVLSIAAQDHGLAAIVAQVPHMSGPASAFAGSPVLAARVGLAGLRDQAGAAFGRQPLRLPAAAEPGTLAMMTTPDATAMMKRLAGNRYEELLPENNVAARIALRVSFSSRPDREEDHRARARSAREERRSDSLQGRAQSRPPHIEQAKF